jgi:hypothetical protein
VRRALTGDEHGTLRLIGGVLFGVGALVLLIRRTAFADPWGDGLVFITLLIPTVLLYGAGFVGARAGGRPNAWQSTFAIFGLALMPLTLVAFLVWIGGDQASSWNSAWIFGLSGVLGFVVALAAGIRYAALAGSLLLVVAWLYLWDAIISGGLGAHFSTSRWLLVAVGLVLLLAAGAVSMRRSEGISSDIVTAAGIPLVVAGGLSGIAASVGGGLIVLTALRSSLFWDIELLVVSLVLLAHGIAIGLRGTAYVGVIGLVVFIGQVGLDLDDKSPSGHAVGWPLVLLVLGALALLAGFGPALRRGR